MTVNSLCLCSPLLAVKNADRVIYAGKRDYKIDGAEFYVEADKVVTDEPRIYLPSLLAENDIINSVADAAACGASVIVGVANTLEEVGVLNAKLNLSPVELLHKLGVLSLVRVSGGVYLDNSDFDLLAQEGTPLIVTPTHSAAKGYGFAHVCTALSRGVTVKLGTGGEFNANGDLNKEAEFLSLSMRAIMNDENALSIPAAQKLYQE